MDTKENPKTSETSSDNTISISSEQEQQQQQQQPQPQQTIQSVNENLEKPIEINVADQQEERQEQESVEKPFDNVVVQEKTVIKKSLAKTSTISTNSTVKKQSDDGDDVDDDDDDEDNNKKIVDPTTTLTSDESGHGEKLSVRKTTDDQYSDYITYNDKGEAIYTDPNTNLQYKFNIEKNDWIVINKESDEKDSEKCNKKTVDSNLYENEHYRWCYETNQWIPKEIPLKPESSENEFYKWDDTKKQWLPKIQQTVTTTSVSSTTSASSAITTNYEDGVHTYVDNDGVKFFWDIEKNAWFPKIDDDFMAMYQMNYGFIDNTTTATTAIKPISSDSEVKKLADNAEDKNKEISGKLKRKGAPSEPQKWFELPPEQNTKVYVSNLPYDITEEEFIDVMSKCGMIFRDPRTNKLKIKLYAEPDGQLKGDGLCHYIKIESVELALNLLDGSDVRGHKIKVQRAQFQMRGEYNPALKPKKRKQDKEKLKKLQEKLFDWRPEKMRGERSKHERSVIIQNLFSPELFDKEPATLLEFQNDLRDECNKCGTVRKVIIYDRHPDGVAQINMSNPEEADVVVQMMHHRFYGKRRLIAANWDGKTKYKIVESENETKERLTNWQQFLETSGADNKEIEKKEKKTDADDNTDNDDVDKVADHVDVKTD